jgi:hypothetical protein
VSPNCFFTLVDASLPIGFDAFLMDLVSEAEILLQWAMMKRRRATLSMRPSTYPSSRSIRRASLCPVASTAFDASNPPPHIPLSPHPM